MTTILIFIVIAAVAFVIFIRKGSLGFWQLVAKHPDEFYKCIQNNDAWTFTKNNQDKLDGPFSLFVPSINSQIKYYGVIGKYEASQAEFTALYKDM